MTPEEIAENCRQVSKTLSPFWVEALDPEERNTLELFCDEADELERYPLFDKLLRDGRVDCTFEIRDDNVVHAEVQKLDEHEMRAFLLTARLFGQNNDRFSIQKIAPIFEKRLGYGHQLLLNFNGYRLGWNRFRGSRGPDLPHTMGEIFDVFLYGHYAHREKKKERLYREWREKLDGFVVRQAIFITALGTFFWGVRGMRDAARKLLAITAGIQGS